MLMVKASGSYGASSQPPSSVKTWSPPLPCWRSRTVTVPKSVCGPMRNWPGSGSPTTSVPGYQLMLKPQVGWPVWLVKKSACSAQGGGQQLQKLVGQHAHAAQVFRHHGVEFRRLGFYHTLGRNHSSSITGSPVGSSAARDQDSLRSGGVSMPSA